MGKGSSGCTRTANCKEPSTLKGMRASRADTAGLRGLGRTGESRLGESCAQWEAGNRLTWGGARSAAARGTNRVHPKSANQTRRECD